MIRRPPKSTLFPSPTLFRSLRFFPAAKGRLFGALYLPEGHDLSCHGGGKHNETRRKLAHYGEDCLGKALMPAGENSKRTCHWLGTLRPPTSGEANFQRRTAFRAAS